jgi:hypothetical protein
MKLLNLLSIGRALRLFTLKIVPTPTIPSDAANKEYVDTHSGGGICDCDILLDDVTEEHLIDHINGHVLLNQ